MKLATRVPGGLGQESEAMGGRRFTSGALAAVEFEDPARREPTAPLCEAARHV